MNIQFTGQPARPSSDATDFSDLTARQAKKLIGQTIRVERTALFRKTVAPQDYFVTGVDPKGSLMGFPVINIQTHAGGPRNSMNSPLYSANSFTTLA